MVIQDPIQFTSAAEAEIQRILDETAIPEGFMLKITSKGHGCAGGRLAIGFDKPKEKDILVYRNTFGYVYEPKDLMFLLGKTVDFYADADTYGFVFY